MTDKYEFKRYKLEGSNNIDIEAIAKSRIRPMTNNEQIRALIKSNNLTYQQAADISGFSWSTIRSWMVNSSSEMARNTPKTSAELFKLKIDAHVLGKD